ncbi:MAG: 50S ribosomal protein L22 [Candidatus Pacebacteria bacterium]|nr:50S ribosomal protein L22 [Candidatus Paceibacterota bacterium]
MSVIAKLNYLRIAPRKVRLVADLIRGKKVGEAQAILNFTVKKATRPLLKLLKSAISNAKQNFQLLDESNLYVSKIIVEEGPKLKRWRARARGTVAPIQKKTSHVTIILDEISKKAKKVKKVKKVEKAKKKKVTRVPRMKKPKLKPEMEISKPKIKKEVKRIFRRKAF